MNTISESIKRHPNPTRKQPRRNAVKSFSFKRLAIAAALSLLGASSAHAVNYTWLGGGTNNNWANAGNFDVAIPAAPGSGNIDLVFNDSARATANANRGANFQVHSFTFNNIVNAQTIGQAAVTDTLVLTQNNAAEAPFITHTGSTNVTFGAGLPLILGANTIINKTGTAGTLLFSGVISETGGPRSLTINGGTGGQVNLDGVNTFTGGLIINGNVVRATNDSATGGSLGNGTVTLTGGELRISNAANTVLTLDATRQIILGNGVINTNSQTININGVLSGLNLIKANAGGTLTINNGANTYTGDTDIRQGTLKIGTGANLPTTTTVKLGFTSTNGTLDLNGTNQQIAGLQAVGTTAASQIIGNSSTATDSLLTFSSAGTSTFGGTIQNVLGAGTRTVGLNVTAGTLNLSGTNTYTGGTSVSSGATLILGAGGTTGLLAGNVANVGTFGIDRSNSVTFAGNITGAGSFAKSGTGVAALTGTNTFSSVAVNAGTLRVQPTSIGGTPAVTVASGSTLEVFNPTATTTVPVKSLGLGADSLSANTLNLLLNGDPTGAALAVANIGGLVSNGSTTINVGTGANALSLGLKSLISYVGAVGGSSGAAPDHGFVLGMLPTRALGSLVTSNPGLIQLNITSIDTIKWTGTDLTNPSYWDIDTTTNWALNSNAAATNYLETAPPGDSVTFDGSAANKSVDLRAIVSPAAVTVNTSLGDYTFTGTGGIAGSGGLVKQGAGTLFITNTGANTSTGGTTVSGGIVHVGNGTDTSSLTGNVSLAATTKLELNPGVTAITIAGDISGAGGLEVQSNTAILTSLSNTYSGGTTIASGATLQIGNGTSSGSLPTTGLVNNGTLAFNPGTLGYQFSGNLTSGAVSILGNNRTTTFLGTGNTFTGGTTIATGAILQIGDGVSSSGSLAGNVAVTGTLNFRPVTSTTFGGDITGTGGKVGGLNGSTLLSGALSYTGVTTVGSGASLQLGDGTKTVGISGNVTNNGTLAINATAGNLSYAGIVSGAGSVNFLGGEVTLSGLNTYSGQTNIAAGAILRAGIVNATNNTTIFNIASGGTFDANGFGSRTQGLTGAGSVTLGLNPLTILTFNNAAITTFDGVISGEGGISRLGGGTQTFTNIQTYTGSTNIQGDNSAIRITVDNALPTTTTLTFGGGTNLNSNLDLNGKNQSIAALTGLTDGVGQVFIQNNSGAGTSILTITNGTGSFGLAPTRARLRDNDTVAVGGKLGLTITGGTTTFKDSHTYTGPTTISGGSYKLGKVDAVSAVSDFTITGSGNIDLAGFNASLLSLNGNGTALGSGGILSVNTGNFSGLVTGAIGFTKANGGTLTLSGLTNDFTGTLRVNNGILELYTLADSGAGSNGNGPIQILNTNQATATLKYLGPTASITRDINVTGNNTTPGSAILESSGSGPLTIGGASRTINSTGLKTLVLSGTNTGLNTVAGVITDGAAQLALAKDGAGSWRLTGVNNYTGTTTVSAGVLAVTGNGTLGTGNVIVNSTLDVSGITPGDFTLAATQALSGDGTINAGTKTIVVPGTLSPGNSPGSLDVTGNLALASTSVSNFEIAGASVGQYDQLNVSGNLLYDGTLNISTTQSAGLFDLFSSLTTSGNFTSVSLTGAFTGSLTNNAGVWTGNDGLNTATFTQATGDLAFTAIPEPSTLVLGALGLLGFGGWSLRRRRVTAHTS